MTKTEDNNRDSHYDADFNTLQKALRDRLIQSEKMAAIGTLAAEIAHEINNPLDYISNYLYLLSESLPQDFPERAYLSKIEAGIDNLSALTRDLLEFSKPRTDVFTLVDIHSVIDAALEFASINILGKKVEIIMKRCNVKPMLMGAARLLQQVLLNLINNSLDAMPNGGSISIATSIVNGRIYLEFEDTGTGIPEAHLPRIFDPFFTTKKSIEKRGTGLGLTICYNIIKQHDGDIEASSRVGEGTKFRIMLPVAK